MNVEEFNEIMGTSTSHTTIRLKKTTRDTLAAQGKKFDTYDMILTKLIKNYEDKK